MSWVDGEIEKSASPIEVNVEHLDLKGEDGKVIPTIEVLPLSAAEYQTLKSDPELKGLSAEDSFANYRSSGSRPLLWQLRPQLVWTAAVRWESNRPRKNRRIAIPFRVAFLHRFDLARISEARPKTSAVVSVGIFREEPPAKRGTQTLENEVASVI